MVALSLMRLINPLYQQKSKENNMAAKWLKKYLTMKPEVAQIFEDLEKYREFCVKYGYPYDERHLYNNNTPWGEFDRAQRGKWPKMNWYAKKERT